MSAASSLHEQQDLYAVTSASPDVARGGGDRDRLGGGPGISRLGRVLPSLKGHAAGVTSLPLGQPAPRTQPRSLAEQIPVGRLAELSGCGGSTTMAVSTVIHCQVLGEPVAWVQAEGGGLYPPDLAASGVDLRDLVVVQVPRAGSARRPAKGAHVRRPGPAPMDRNGLGAERRDLARAAELLLRSGAFGLVVIDFRGPMGESRNRGASFGQAVLGRLAGLARQHHSRVLLLTDATADEPSLGPMVGIRVEPRRERRGPGRFVLLHRVLKDKTGLGVEADADRRRGPWGLG